MNPKPSKIDVLNKVREVLRTKADDPIEELRATGLAMVAIADALKPLSAPEARATIEAVAKMEGMA